MARGAEAKIIVENKIREIFGKDFLGVQDKKLYVQAEENGEMVQVALSLTCPKIPIGVSEDTFSAPTEAPSSFQPAEITKEETENIKKLLAEFGL